MIGPDLSDKLAPDDNMLQHDQARAELKRKSLACYQPEKVRVLQMNDPAIGKVISWSITGGLLSNSLHELSSEPTGGCRSVVHLDS